MVAARVSHPSHPGGGDKGLFSGLTLGIGSLISAVFVPFIRKLSNAT